MSGGANSLNLHPSTLKPPTLNPKPSTLNAQASENTDEGCFWDLSLDQLDNIRQMSDQELETPMTELVEETQQRRRSMVATSLLLSPQPPALRLQCSP